MAVAIGFDRLDAASNRFGCNEFYLAVGSVSRCPPDARFDALER